MKNENSLRNLRHYKTGAVLNRTTNKSAPVLDFKLYPKQVQALTTDANYLLYGGSAGGGKSHLARVWAILTAFEIPGAQIYFFRRRSADLEKNHLSGVTGLRAMLAELVNAKLCTIVEDKIRFWNGSQIYLCHCQHEKDLLNYQGAEITFLIIEEATQFTEHMIRYLRSRVRRSATLKIPDKYKGIFPRTVLTSNPGGVGHTYLKQEFIDARPQMEIGLSDEGFKTQYIPARLQDNPSLDPAEYTKSLLGLRSPALIKAYLDGDWSAVLGAYFECFQYKEHVIEPFPLHPQWTKFMSFDWGSYRPFACYWFTVVSEPFKHPTQDIMFRRDDLIIYREWYGAQKPNEGLQLTNEMIARGILAREEKGENLTYRVADPAIFIQAGGQCIAEQMYLSGTGVSFQPADNSRIAGWQQLRSRLIGYDSKPCLYFFNTCLEAIRTLPALQHDDKKPDDVDSDGEDHAADAIRYGCMSRPWATEIKKVEPQKNMSSLSLNELISLEKKRKARARWAI